MISRASARRAALTLGVLLLTAASLPAASAAAPAPAWTITSSSSPTRFVPGDSSGDAVYLVELTNSGGAATDGTPITITDVLPAGLTVNPFPFFGGVQPLSVVNDGQQVKPCNPGPPATCVVSEIVHPGQVLTMRVPVVVDPGAPPIVTNQVSASGGGAAAVSATGQTAVDPDPSAPGFQSHESSFTDSGGNPESRAGAHPYRLRIGFQLNTNTNISTEINAPAATPKNITTKLPAGFVVNPAASPVLCTEAQLETVSCPDASAVGIVHTTVGIFGFATPSDLRPVYNMVPPPGAPAELAFNGVGFGFFVHLLGGVDSAGDYSLTADVKDIPQYGQISGASVDLWGDPSDPSHDFQRGKCGNALGFGKTCPVSAATAPLLTMPSACSGPLATTITTNSWEDPGNFISASAVTEDSSGNPVGVSGCGKLEFTPSIAVQPDTGSADSPTGLHVNLHVPQTQSQEGLATANLKDAVVTLPKGMAVNPSAADGLGACSSAQIGLHSAAAANCPPSSKVGTVSIETPLLDHPLPGAVYLAKQLDNPFNSLLALYIVVDDPTTGIVVKLAGKVEPDPVTGQLKTTFLDNPQLPFEDFDVDFTDGPRAALTTPPTCGTHTTTTDLTPWTSPQGADAFPADSFQIGSGANGGACAFSEAQMPNQPAFAAGTQAPLAGSYSPFVLNLSRENGSQRLQVLDVTLPPGLTGKLAGLQQCSEAQIAVSAGRKNPGEGALEQASPSCPAASEVGTVTVGAGSGAPFHVQGRAYLSGPYKGAPISLAIVTPAVAGPFDLGTIVVRTALYVNSETAQITAKSDPIPAILQGIPLDVRSISVQVNRNQFTLNPTSCEPMTIGGAAISTLGQSASLSNRFQVGGCKGLDFAPKLSIRLKGGTRRGAYPQLRAVLQAKPGEANVGKVSVALPHSEFLAQNHIRTICTRVQFAAHQCPAGSIYGKVRAISPLVDYALEGPVYLRSSSNPLPDLVASVSGPANQPIEVNTVGRIDSVNGGIRTNFNAFPDVAITKVVLTMKGGKKSLLINSRNICGSTNKATVKMSGQNGKTSDSQPALQADCSKKK